MRNGRTGEEGRTPDLLNAMSHSMCGRTGRLAERHAALRDARRGRRVRVRVRASGAVPGRPVHRERALRARGPRCRAVALRGAAPGSWTGLSTLTTAAGR